MLFDTHCHLTHERYGDDLSGVMDRAAEAGIRGIVAVASDLEDAARVREIVRDAEAAGGGGVRVWGTAGVHPHEAHQARADLRSRLTDALGEPGTVAVGECGLDFHYDFSPRDVQRRIFGLQVELAAETGLPLVVHCREAEGEMAALVREAGRAGVSGVLHCFPGDLDLLAAVREAGWLVSFTGLVTFKNFGGGAAVRTVASDGYMLETDGPYMAPVPHRGKRNESAWIPLIRDHIAELRGESPEAVERDTGRTAIDFFRLTIDP